MNVHVAATGKTFCVDGTWKNEEAGILVRLETGGYSTEMGNGAPALTTVYGTMYTIRAYATLRGFPSVLNSVMPKRPFKLIIKKVNREKGRDGCYFEATVTVELNELVSD